MSEMFAEEFSDEMAKQFQETMKGLMGNDPKMMEQFEKLAEAAEKSGILNEISDLLISNCQCKA